MTLELVVLGSSGSHTAPGQVCSGYLLRHGDTQVVVDCGNGSTANLQRHTTFGELDAIVVTHRHLDHCADLVGMFYALRFDPDGPTSVPLYAAPEVASTLTGLLSSDSAMAFREVFEVHDVDAGDSVTIGGMRFEFHPSVHPPPTLSVRVQAGDAVLAYSSDSAGGADLVACAEGADLFLCEATWQGDADLYPDGVHLTARQAGAHATEADVGHLVLTHVVGSADREVSRAQARETFAGPIDVAADNARFVVSGTEVVAHDPR